jgi:hypothetical protein
MVDCRCLLAEYSFMVAEQKKNDAACALPESAPEPEGASGLVEGEYWRWCPHCGHELHHEKCKLPCPRCHFFMSCSDFD